MIRVLSLISATMIADPAWSQNIRQACEAQGLSGAGLGNCLVEEATRQSKDLKRMKGMICSASRCYLLLQCSGDEGARSCEGEGFEISFRAEDWGTTTIVQDPDGHVSEFGRCGTCSEYEYVSGPIAEIEMIRLNADDIEVYFSFSIAR